MRGLLRGDHTRLTQWRVGSGSAAIDMVPSTNRGAVARSLAVFFVFLNQCPASARVNGGEYDDEEKWHEELPSVDDP